MPWSWERPSRRWHTNPTQNRQWLRSSSCP